MWFTVVAICTFKILCIFVFIIYSVVTFLLVMYPETEELRKCIVPEVTNEQREFLTENCDNVDYKFEALAGTLTKKEHPHTQCELTNAEKVLTILESKPPICRDRYRSLINELKKDVRQTEEEVKTLQNQISSLFVHREALRNEVLKEHYQKMPNNCFKTFEISKCEDKLAYCFLYEAKVEGINRGFR